MAPPRCVLLVLLGCLALSRSSRVPKEAPSEPEGADLEEVYQMMGRFGRLLLFDMNELYQMETLRATEEQVLAVMDGRSKPLFSQKALFSPEPVNALFGSPGGSSQQEGQGVQEQQQEVGAATKQAMAKGTSGGQNAITAPGQGQQQQAKEGGLAATTGDASTLLTEGQQTEASKLEAAVQAAAAAKAARLVLLRDSEAGEDGSEVPEPEMQYKDEGSVRINIWLPQDTLPRDLLLGRKPQVWLYSLLNADYDAAMLLPHFLDHYVKLGIHPGNMLFVVNHNPQLEGMTPSGLSNVTALLDAHGLDYRVWRGQYSGEAHLRHKLQVLARVPVRDWIVVAAPDELHEYSGLTASQFLLRRDNEGTNFVRGVLVDRVSAPGALAHVERAPSLFSQFPLKCDVSRRVAHAPGSKVVAFKGYLRPGANNEAALSISEARRYYGPSAAGEEGPRRSALCGAEEDLFPLTPYARYWKFYKAPDVQGNVYLWDAREGEPKVKVNHFKWRAGVDRRVADRLKLFKEESEACGGEDQPRPAAWEEAQRVQDTVISKGAIDVTNNYLRCQLAEDPRMPQPRRQAGAKQAQAQVAAPINPPGSGTRTPH